MPAARRGPAVGPRAPPQPDLLHPWRAQRGDPRPPRWAQRPADEEARRQPACPLRATRPPRPTTPAGRPLTSWPAGSGAASTSTYHVLVERHAYSVPFQLLREQVEVRYTTATVEVFFKGRRVTSPPAPLRRAAVHRRRAHAERPPRPRRVDAVAPPPLGREGRSRDRPARGPHPAEPPAPPSRGTGPCSASCAWGGSTATTGSTRLSARAIALGSLAASTPSGTSSPPARTGCPSSRRPQRADACARQHPRRRRSCSRPSARAGLERVIPLSPYLSTVIRNRVNLNRWSTTTSWGSGVGHRQTRASLDGVRGAGVKAVSPAKAGAERSDAP